eukprot:1827613-Lingulodinium_polyedra.AAC.1
MEFGADWSPAVIAADASPGGHGLAYCDVALEEAQVGLDGPRTGAPTRPSTPRASRSRCRSACGCS